MRILAISYEYPPVGGGGGQATHDVLHQLSQAGHTIDVVTMRTPGLPSESSPTENLTVHRVFSGRVDLNRCGLAQVMIYLLFGWLKARRLARYNSYDVTHATFIFPSAIIADFIARQDRISFVVTAHGSDVPGHNKSFGALFRLLEWWWLKIVKRAQTVTTISEYLASKIEKLSGLEAKVIPNGVAIADFPQTNYDRRILIVGRLQKFKNFDRSIKAFARSKAAEQGYSLEVVGDGPDRGRLRQLAQRLDVPVNFRGRISRTDLIKLYGQSSILISASKFESFGGVLMEAMAGGLAVIATDVGGCRELVGEAGLIIEANSSQQILSALDTYVGDEELLRERGQRARQRIRENYDIKLVAKAYEDVLRSASKTKYV